MKFVVATLLFVVSVLPVLLGLWRQRATLGARHLAVFAAMLAVGGTVVAVFWPHMRPSGEPNWGQMGALFVVLGGAGLALIGAIGLCGVLLLRALPPPSAPATLPRERELPRSRGVARAAATAAPAAAPSPAPASWTAPSPRARPRAETPRDPAPPAQPWYALVAGVAGVWIFCALMWLYAGAALYNGVFHVPIGRRSHYVLTGPVAALASIALMLLTLALFMTMLQRIDPQRSARWRAWRQGSVWAAIGVLAAALLLQIARRLF
jgi:hypothetical protein